MDDREAEKLVERRRDLLDAYGALVDAFRRAPSMDLATFMLGEASAARKEIEVTEKKLGADRIENGELSR